MATDAVQLRDLGARIRRRREQLELSLRDAAERVGMSTTTWINTEQGLTRAQGVTLAKIDRSLRWESGSCQAILEGREPVTLHEAERPKSDDTFDLVTQWAKTDPGLEPHEREFILAIIEKTRPRS